MSINYNKDLISDSIWVQIPSDNVNENSRPYYYNKTTKLTTWVEPQEYTDWYESEIKKYLKSISWRKHLDSKSNKYYYYDKTKLETHWKAPSELEHFLALLQNVNYARRKSLIDILESKTVAVTATATETEMDVSVVHGVEPIDNVSGHGYEHGLNVAAVDPVNTNTDGPSARGRREKPSKCFFSRFSARTVL